MFGIGEAVEGHLTRQRDQFVRELDGFLQRDGILPPGQSIAGIGHNDQLDAIRHAYVTGRFADTYGGPTAEAIGREHEKRHPNDAAERAMDLHNNAMGAKWSGETHSPEALYNRIIQGVQNGELIIAPQTQNNGNYRSSADTPSLNEPAGQLVNRVADATGSPDSVRIAAALGQDNGNFSALNRSTNNDGYVATVGNQDFGRNVPIPDSKINQFTQETAVASLNASLTQQQQNTPQIGALTQDREQERAAPRIA